MSWIRTQDSGVETERAAVNPARLVRMTGKDFMLSRGRRGVTDGV